MNPIDDPRLERLDAVLDRLADPRDSELREAVVGLLDGLRWLHAEGLKRLTDLLAEDPGRFRRALDDPHISNLLLLYDLVVVDERERTLEALESLRPFMRGHGGEVELLGVEEGVVRLRLLGSCQGCPSSTATLRQGIERALADRLPGFKGLEIRGEDVEDGRRASAPAREAPEHRAERARSGAPVSFVPVEKMSALEERLDDATGKAEGIETSEAELGPLDGLPRDVLHGLLHDNYPILVVIAGGEVLAYQNTCPGSLLPLHLGTLEDGVVVCPWHGCRFDVRTGERLDGSGPPLHRLEARVGRGRVRVRVT